MPWTIEASRYAEKEFKKLDKQSQKKIRKFLTEHVLAVDDPRQGGSLTRMNGDLNNIWRARAGDFRLTCLVDQAKQSVCLLSIGHRREAYLKKEADKTRDHAQRIRDGREELNTFQSK